MCSVVLNNLLNICFSTLLPYFLGRQQIAQISWRLGRRSLLGLGLRVCRMSDHRETHNSEHHCKLGGSTKEGKDVQVHVHKSYNQKFDGESKFDSLAVGVETIKLKSTNIISHATCNDAMHAVALLAPSGTPLRELFLVLAHCQFYFFANLWICSSTSWSSERRQHSLINKPGAPLPNWNSANIYLRPVFWGQTANFKDGHCFRLYSTYIILWALS